ncbi:MAG: tetratricopeptide repeat protein [Hyphomicrobiaceae bacterium]
MEAKALSCQSSGDWKRAVELFEAIVAQQPDWEHGLAWSNLAGCYEELNELPAARNAYEQAMKFSRRDLMIWGNFASFLFLHGDIKEAFDEHLRLYGAAVQGGDADTAQTVILALQTLAPKLGWTNEDIDLQLSRARNDQFARKE